MTISKICRRYYKAYWLKWQTPLEKVRWVCCAPVVTSLLFHSLSLIAIVLSQTNKSKYFFPLRVCDTFICIDVEEVQFPITPHENITHKKSMKFLPIWFYFGQDNLYALSVQYGYNTNGTKVRNGHNENYIKVKKEKWFETCCPNELCNKSLIISLSVKDSSMENVLFMTELDFMQSKRHFNIFTQPKSIIIIIYIYFLNCIQLHLYPRTLL